jgi:hypothetical protein
MYEWKEKDKQMIAMYVHTYIYIFILIKERKNEGRRKEGSQAGRKEGKDRLCILN